MFGGTAYNSLVTGTNNTNYKLKLVQNISLVNADIVYSLYNAAIAELDDRINNTGIIQKKKLSRRYKKTAPLTERFFLLIL